MDTFAHAAWTYIIFHATNNPLLAVFFGIMPDLFSWTIVMFYSIFKRGMKFGKPDIRKIPKWAHPLYGITHSVFVFFLTIIIVFIFTKTIPIYLWAWLIHILIDIPTHSRDFLPTPFLWPISDWAFPGISWGQRWFMITNWSAIIVAFILIIFL